MNLLNFSVNSPELANYIIAYASLGAVLFCISVFVYFRSPKNALNRVFAAYSMAIAWWSLLSIPMIANTNEHAALVWDKVCLIGAIFIPSTFIHFVIVFLQKEKKLAKIILFSYGASFVFLITNILGVFILEVRPRFSFNYYTVPGLIYTVFVSFFSLISTLGVFLLFRGTVSEKKKDNSKYNQTKWLFFFSLLGYLGGGFNFLLVYGINLPIITPIANYAVLAYGISLAYIILKYRFLDIEVIIRRTVVFAGLLAFVFGIFSAATFLVQEVLIRFGLGSIWTYGISLFLIVLGYDPIRNFLVNTTDKYLFQKKYDYQKILKDATRGMAKIESLHHLLALVVHFITMKMRIKNGAVMTRRRDNDFELGFQRGYDKNFFEYRLDSGNPLILYLMNEKEAVDIERVKEAIDSRQSKKVKGANDQVYDFHAIKLTMEELQASCCIPSFLGRDLKNILIMGEKKSGDYYTKEDIDVLYTLAQESAIAIENAKLFDEAINKTKQLSKINEQLEYSKNLLMKALRETEVANKQLQDTQAQLIHEQKMATLGRLAASVGHEVNNPLTILSMNVSRAILKYRKNTDLKVGEVLDLFQKMEQNIARIKAVVNTLTGLLKRSEKGKFEPLSLKLILEETLPLVQFQTYLDNLTGTEVEFDIPGSIPLIRGDLERLQEVFLNLFINAYHAMAGRRNRKIRVTAEISKDNGEQVLIHFTDNGSGIPEDIMKKIFNYGFTTKPPGKGSGMGLYMCKYIIELHGGDIRVSSQVGEGTTFTIMLPAAIETTGEIGGLQMGMSS